jgi:hypothetical protein
MEISLKARLIVMDPLNYVVQWSTLFTIVIYTRPTMVKTPKHVA